MRTTDQGAVAYLLTAATVVLVIMTRIHPLLLLAAGAGVGMLGLL
jgi:hypothetical protein